MNIEELRMLLTNAISPITLVSGIGLLLLTITNRYGRIIDRVRSLIREARGANEADRQMIRDELHVLLRRVQLLQRSVVYSGGTIFCTSIVLVCLFLGTVLRWPLENVILTLFCLALVCLVMSVSYFVLDLRHSLKALLIEVRASSLQIDEKVLPKL